MEIAKLIETGFSTADAEYPEILQIEGDVILKFQGIVSLHSLEKKINQIVLSLLV